MVILHVRFVEDDVIREIEKCHIEIKEKLAILRGTRDNVFFDFEILNKDGNTYISYNTGNMKGLREFSPKNMGELMNVLVNIIEAGDALRDLWFFPGSYHINLDTVYISEDLKKVKFIFSPNGSYYDEILKGIEYNLGDIILNLIGEICQNETISEELRGYIRENSDEIKDIIGRSKYNVKKLLTEFKKLRRKMEIWG